MAHARARREARNLSERISRTDEKRWRAVRSLCHLERSVLCRHSFFWQSRHALCTSVRSGRPAGRIPRSSRRCRNPTTSSCGCMPCSRCFRRRWRRQLCSLVRCWSILGLLLLPFLSGEGEKSWSRRPIAVLTVMLIAITLGTFTHLAGYTPWSPHMNAWSGDPVPAQFLHWHDCPRAARRARLSGQAMPQLPFARRDRRAKRSGARQRCRAAHARPAHPPGDPGRWQHAGVRQESEPGGDHRARRVSRNPASGRTSARARRLTRYRAKARAARSP